MREKLLRKECQSVAAYIETGSYQGRWFAAVELVGGERCFLSDYYGSCSGCDDIEGVTYGHDCVDGVYKWGGECFAPGCTKCDDVAAKYREIIAGYIEAKKTSDEAMKLADDGDEWDASAPEAIEFVAKWTPWVNRAEAA